jgi:preprotein translocase SecE subunit
VLTQTKPQGKTMADPSATAPPVSEKASLGQLGVLGTLYVIAAFLAVVHLIPWAFSFIPATANRLLTGFGLIASMAAAAAAAIYLWRLTFPKLNGLRAAVAVGVGNVIIGFLVVFIVGYLIDWIVGDFLNRIGPEWRLYTGLALMTVIGFWWVRSMILRRFQAPGFPKRMQKLEDGGWFDFAAYKKMQGLRIRRITMLALILTVGLGVWYYYIRPGMAPLGTALTWNIPFVSTHDLIIVRAASLTMPVLLIAFSIWFSYRLVNYPTFAEFLINTEAELAKVSWSTRKRLIRDTGVVLLTVLILASFLYAFDILWVIILQKLHVLHG